MEQRITPTGFRLQGNKSMEVFKMTNKKAPKGASDKRLTIRMSDKLYTRIFEEAHNRGTNMNQLMLYILNQALN